MKKNLLLSAIILFVTNVVAQSIDVGIVTDEVDLNSETVRINLTDTGKFIIVNKDDLAKFIFKESGEVNWFLDGADYYIRESNFEYESGKTGTYDFLFVDGANGRTGINVLSNTTGGLDDNVLTSSVNLFGSISTRIRVLDGSESYSIRQDDHTMIIDKQTNGDSNIILPLTASATGRQLKFKRDDFKDGKIIIKPQSGETLNGVVNGEIDLNLDNSFVEIVCGPSGWWILSEVGAVIFNDVSVYSADFTPDLNEKYLEVNFTANNQDIALNLPTAASAEGVEYSIKRNANGVTSFTGTKVSVKPNGSENIDGFTNASPYILSNNFESVVIYSNGTRWQIKASHDH